MALEKVLALDATGVIEKEIDTGGGGGGSAITSANICDLLMDSADYINANNPIFSEPLIGGGALLLAPSTVTGTTNYIQLGVAKDTAAAVSGTGAAATPNVNNIALTTGTTAAAYARIERRMYLTTLPKTPVSFYGAAPLDGIGLRMAARCTAVLAAASDATNTYSASVTLLGVGPATNAAVSSTDAGFTLTYTHSVNSGNWVITYRTAAGALGTVNTTIPPVFGGNGAAIVAKLVRTGAGTSSVVITIGGVVAATITNSMANTIPLAFITLAIAARIIKTVGTTARTLTIAAAAVAHNYL